MPRENSLSDSEGRSLTPDPEDEVIVPASPTYSQQPRELPAHHHVDLGRITSRASKAQSKKSLHSKVARANPQSPLAQPSTWATLPPADRFRSAVRKVMSMRRGLTTLGNMVGRVGAEPGVDPHRPEVDAAYSHIHEDCEIEIMDYSAVRNTSRNMNNAQFVEFMNVDSEGLPPRDPWVKVRWINIGGISWDVIKALSIKYNLHPLALEDVFHGHSRNRSKADYYTRHLFLRVLCHELADEHQPFEHSYTNAPRSDSPEPIDPPYPDGEEGEKLAESETTKFGSGPNSGAGTLIQRRGRSPILPTNRGDIKAAYTNGTARSPAGTNLSAMMAKETARKAAHVNMKMDEAAINALKEGSRVNVRVSPMFFFLFRDGTVISIRPAPNLSFTAPISFRLRSRDTVLRKSADPSLLLHALLDLIVDKAVQVIDEYHAHIHKFERDILLRPKMGVVRQLHILSGDLILHKRTLDPIKTLIYGLRRYDIDRCAALVDTSDPANKDVKIVGFMSHKAKIYLADVFDHMEYILTSLDMFAGISENLINYSFNVASYEMNDVMRRLTIATIICLPLTLLTGYFGMNFTPMWSVNHNSDLLFWKIALPIMVVIIPLALWGDLSKIWHYIQKKSVTKKALKVCHGNSSEISQNLNLNLSRNSKNDT
ncbi:hypothetical protein GALMADRAFT_51400 [Galerina marginata CBS 339.88]|uniref:Magnesium transporter n=1 Tax=Galerina marginata (strain CBS 339.88) TaxID=685588 RepID=A0A067TRH6_GALM3|nr:hypothetical protein GALMADRAFT_51400 [Galerina marginata CBS 339.88]